MRPGPSQFFLLCTITLAKAAVFDRGERSRRDGDEGKLFGGQGQARETVTETVRQTISINGGGAHGSFNITATETVTVSVHIATDVTENDDAGQAHAESFEGFRISFVTETVVATQPPSTTTIAAEASTITVLETIPASTVTETLPAETIVQTVTQSCAVANLPANTPRTTIGELLPAAPSVVVNPVPIVEGNGVGVSTVPIADSALPRTTLTYDPLATPSIGYTSSPPTLPATPTGSAEEPGETGVGGAEEPPNSDYGDDSESDDDEDEDDDEEGDDENAPDPSAPANSVVENTSNSAGATTAPANALPSIDLSSFSLDSQLNLGNLIPRTDVPRAQPTDVP